MRAQARAHTDTPACILACLHPLAFKPLPCVSTCYRSLSPSLLRQREAAEDGQPPQQPHRRGASPSTSLHPSNPKRAFARLHPPELVSLGWQGDSRLIVHTIAVALGARRGVVGSKRRRARHLFAHDDTARAPHACVCVSSQTGADRESSKDTQRLQPHKHKHSKTCAQGKDTRQGQAQQDVRTRQGREEQGTSM